MAYIEIDDSSLAWFSWPVMIFAFILFVLYYYFMVYFNIEIITRTDFDLRKKTNWVIVNNAFPLLGNAAYAYWGNRHNATFN